MTAPRGVWVTFGSNQLIQFGESDTVSFESIQARLGGGGACRILHNGVDVPTNAAIAALAAASSSSPLILQVKLRIVGGKGGFGALLRSKKATVKTTNFGACRDLNGRRLRHVEQERALQEWQATAAQREAEKKRSELETKDNAASTTRFTDTAFASETIQYCDSVAEAVRKKRKDKSKKDEDDDEDDDDDDDDDVDAAAVAPPVAKKSKKLFDDDEFGDDDESTDEPKKKNETASG
jgi:hypothetical protein